MSKVQPDWLVARAIAHRGLHDVLRQGLRDEPRDETRPVTQGITQRKIENSASAAQAACAKNYAIECDVQLSADLEAMVFHDFTLERLTNAAGRIDKMSAQDLSKIALKNSADCIMTLPRFLAEIAGKTPLICEIKSNFNGDLRLAERTAECAANYAGPMALKSFDPSLIAHLQNHRAQLRLENVPIGMISQANYDDPADEWAHFSRAEKHALAQFLHYENTRPDFLSYGVNDLPHAVPFLCRAGLKMPVMTWTVRTAKQLKTAQKWADQIIFEGNPAQC